MKNISKKTLVGLFWSFSETGVIQFFNVLFLIILARLLSPTEFGLFGAAMVVIGISELFSMMGISHTIIQSKKINQEHISTSMVTSLFFGLAFTFLVWLSAPLISNFLSISGLVNILRVLSLVFVLDGMKIVANALMIRELKFRLLAKIRTISYFFGYGVLSILFAILGFGVWSLVIGHIGNTIINILLLFLNNRSSFRFGFNLKYLKYNVNHGLGFTLTNLFDYLAKKIDNLVVVKWLGATSLGIYGRAYNLTKASGTMLSMPMYKVLFPIMAKIQDDTVKLYAGYRRAILLISIFVLPLGAALFFLAPEIILALLGPVWQEVILPFRFLVIAIPLFPIIQVNNSIIKAKGYVYKLTGINIIYVFMVGLGAFIGKRWDLIGVSIGVSLAILVNFILNTNLVLNLLDKRWNKLLKIFIPPIFLGIIIALESYFLVSVLRMYRFDSLVLLIICIMVLIFSFILLIFLMPKFFLGKDGKWFVEIIGGYIPDKLKFIIKNWKI